MYAAAPHAGHANAKHAASQTLPRPRATAPSELRLQLTSCACALLIVTSFVRTDVIDETLLALLQKYDPSEPHYFGRPLQEEGYPAFVGGGAGIVLSRAAARIILEMRESDDCNPLNLKWGERTHQGGDAWLGDCAEASGVHVDMEYGFYPQPPVADLFHLYTDAVAFHGVEDHKAMHDAITAYRAKNASHKLAARAQTDPRCVPVFVDHKYTCLPHFIIGGVPKAGTTSLYKYLLQHPEVRPAKDKELTFWGNVRLPPARPPHLYRAPHKS